MLFKPTFFTILLIALSGVTHAQFHQDVTISDTGGQLIRAGDLDGDGVIDMVARSGGHLFWAKGDGDGTYTDQGIIVDGQWDWEITIDDLITFEIIDLDSDGDDDIIAIQEEGDTSAEGIYIVKSLGGGNFSDPVLIGSQHNIVQIGAANLDGNNLPDLVCGSTNSLYLYKQISPYSFEETIITDSLDFSYNGASYLDLADANNDGFIDIKCCHSHASIVYNDGNANFEEFEEYEWVSYSGRPAVLEDFDGDGDIDIATLQTGEDVIYYENVDGQMVEVPNAISLRDPDSVTSIIVEDFNMDGQIDLAVGSWMRSTEIHLNLGNNNFAPIRLCDGNGIAEYGLVAADFNLDGAPDLGIARAGYYYFEYFVNNLPFCNDVDACNYNAEWDGENLNCCYSICGCTNEDALNYDEGAECDNGSCVFETEVRVFDDINLNGVKNSDEPYLENVIVQLEPGDYTTVTLGGGGLSGLAQFFVPNGQYQASVILPENYSLITTGLTTIEANCHDDNSNTASVGIATTENLNSSGELSFFYSSNVGLCDQQVSGNLCFTHSGTSEADYLLNIQPGPLVQNGFSVLDDDTVASGDGYTLLLEGVYPGEYEMTFLEWYNPDFSEMGNPVEITATLSLADTPDLILDTLEFSTPLTCSYDPNDKLVWPEGILEGNFVPLGSSLKYTLRFQNTGTAPAQTVILRDTLPQHLDFSTFSIIGRSNLCYFSYEPSTREMVFTFPDIQLPPAEEDEPGSHGFVAFRIEHNEDLVVTTEVRNTAYIYFDANPPIVTNTTLTTLYQCNDFFAAFQEQELPTCANETTTIFANVSTASSYEWLLDGNAVSTDATCTLSDLSIGVHSLSLNIESPICDAEYEMDFTVEDCAVGIDDMENVTRLFNVFPNPTNQAVSIVSISGEHTTVDVQMYSTTGQLILDRNNIQTGHHNTLDVSNLADGLYHIQIFNEANGVLQRELLIKY